MKKCHICAEEIKDEAKKCRYCGEWISKNSDSINNPIRLCAFWWYLIIGGLSLVVFVAIKITKLIDFVKYHHLYQGLWCLGWAAIGISLGLWNSRNAKGKVLNNHWHYCTYFVFVLFIATFAAFVALGTLQNDPIRPYVVATLTGVIVGFVGDSLPEKFFGLIK